MEYLKIAFWVLVLILSISGFVFFVVESILDWKGIKK